MTNDDDFLTPTEGSETWIAELRRRCPTPEETDALCDRAERLAAIEPDYKNALGMIRFRGVPEQRAEHLAHALDVLLTRLDREIQSHRVVESAIERQVLWRTEDMPEWADIWFKEKSIGCGFVQLDGQEEDEAPDYRPDEPGPLFLPILDPET